MHYLQIVETILRNREGFFKEVRKSTKLPDKIKSMLIASCLFLALYGAVMGGAKGWEQMISSTLKLPFLFLATLAICLPSLHFFSILFGSKQTFSQTLTLILTAMSTTSILAVSLGTIAFFFMITGSSYGFMKLLHVVFLGIAGYQGTLFLNQGMSLIQLDSVEEGQMARKTVYKIWLVLYALVGTQMAWLLSPFLGNPESPFIIFRRTQGNFYLDVIQTIGELIGF